MNKKLVILILLLAASVLSVSAEPGGEKRLGFGFGVPNTVFIFQGGPYDLKIGYDFTEGDEYMFLGGSYMLINSRPMFENVTGTMAIGLFGRIAFGDNDDDFIGGMNIPLSAEIAFIDNFLEFFVTVAPGIELYPKPAFTKEAINAWAGFTIMID